MTDQKPKKAMPVRKGGTRYPRQAIAEALPWSKKLVVKTHLGPQPQAVVLSGVVGNSGSVGQVRLSTLKQYGLMEGDSTGYVASELARKIEAAPSEELSGLLRSAALNPTVFKALFDTFNGDEVTVARLKQRAAELKVHPEETEKCVENYASSLVTAGLATRNGDKISHLSAVALSQVTPPPPIDTPGDERETEALGVEEPVEVGEDEEGAGGLTRPRGAIFNINVTLDSSLDTEKLERQLQLLKRYGAL